MIVNWNHIEAAARRELVARADRMRPVRRRVRVALAAGATLATLALPIAVDAGGKVFHLARP